MILYFSSADLPSNASKSRCLALRSHGFLLHVPSLAAPPDTLSAMPFRIIMLHFDRSPEGLPSIEMLRTAFPRAILFSLAEKDIPGAWRVLPRTDYESLAPSNEDLIAYITNVRSRHGMPDEKIVSPGLFLPSARKEALLRGAPLALTGAEWTILRTLCYLTPMPLSSAFLAGMIRRPLSPVPLESIPTHICQINRKASSLSASRLIIFKHQKGYMLSSPYCHRTDKPDNQ